MRKRHLPWQICRRASTYFPSGVLKISRSCCPAYVGFTVGVVETRIGDEHIGPMVAVEVSDHELPVELRFLWRTSNSALVSSTSRPPPLLIRKIGARASNRSQTRPHDHVAQPIAVQVDGADLRFSRG